jgi:hypothetical protein
MQATTKCETKITLSLGVADYVDLVAAFINREHTLSELIAMDGPNQELFVNELARIKALHAQFNHAYTHGPMVAVRDGVHALPPMEEVETDSPETELHGTEDN